MLASLRVATVAAPLLALALALMTIGRRGLHPVPGGDRYAGTRASWAAFMGGLALFPVVLVAAVVAAVVMV